MKKGSAGGIATAILLREQAIARYLLVPNFCEECYSSISVGDGQKVSEVRKKRFCNRSCAASYNNRAKPKIKKEVKIKEYKKTLPERTKADLFGSSKNWTTARSQISRHARKVYAKSGKSFSCSFCGYSLYTEVCHLLDVKDFSEDSTVESINSIDNLIRLCPNHHWEFDNGLLSIEEINIMREACW